MALNQNQFGQAVVQGQLDLHSSNQGNVISCQVASTQATALVAGEAVKLADVAGGVPKVVSLAADTEAAFGFVVRNSKDIERVAGETLEIAFANTVMYMTAGAAIARGASVEYDVSKLEVITSAGTNPVIGYALDKAAASGDLIRVYIQTPVTGATPIFNDLTIGGNLFRSIQVYNSGAGALPIDKDVVLLETGGAEALTLADGVAGQQLIIIMTVDGGDGTLTPANYLNGTTITFDDTGDSVHLIFNGTNWCNVGTPTATVA